MFKRIFIHLRRSNFAADMYIIKLVSGTENFTEVIVGSIPSQLLLMFLRERTNNIEKLFLEMVKLFQESTDVFREKIGGQCQCFSPILLWGKC